MNENEKRLMESLEKEGFIVIRSSESQTPDFRCFRTPEVQIESPDRFGVEEKSGGDKISKSQTTTFERLARVGEATFLSIDGKMPDLSKDSKDLIYEIDKTLEQILDKDASMRLKSPLRRAGLPKTNEELSEYLYKDSSPEAIARSQCRAPSSIRNDIKNMLFRITGGAVGMCGNTKNVPGITRPKIQDFLDGVIKEKGLQGFLRSTHLCSVACKELMNRGEKKRKILDKMILSPGKQYNNLIERYIEFLEETEGLLYIESVTYWNKAKEPLPKFKIKFKDGTCLTLPWEVTKWKGRELS